MNTNELMRADWVSYNGTPCQVSIISNDLVTIVNENLDDVDRDDIEPIPITYEILKKNGFKLDKESVVDNSWYYGNNITWVYTYKHESGKFIFLSENPSVAKLESFVQYVHELQHALRLCRINKEIEL